MTNTNKPLHDAIRAEIASERLITAGLAAANKAIAKAKGEA